MLEGRGHTGPIVESRHGALEEVLAGRVVADGPGPSLDLRRRADPVSQEAARPGRGVILLTSVLCNRLQTGPVL